MRLQQLSFDVLFGGSERARWRGDFSPIPLLARPSYLASLRDKNCLPDFLFRNKVTKQIGILLNPAKDLYYLASPTLISSAHKQDNQIIRPVALNGWQAVCEQLELVGYDGAIFTLTGSDDEQRLT